MKALRISTALICICIAMNGLSQDTDTTEVYYEYELIQTENPAGNDTVYQVFLIIDSLELNHFKKLLVLNENQEKIITIKSNGLDNDPAIKAVGTDYRINIDYWSSIEDWMVIGEREDKSQKYLKDKKKEKAFKHVIIDTPIPVNMSLRRTTPLDNDKEL